MTPPDPQVPPQIGVQITGDTLNIQSGDAARRLKQASDDLFNLAKWSEAYTDVELEAFGIAAGMGDDFKSAMGEATTLATSINGSQFLKKLWGTGV